MGMPDILPPIGTPVDGLPDALRLMAGMARHVSSQTAIDPTGVEMGDNGRSGNKRSTMLPCELKCFEITSCWSDTNPVPEKGASDGKFWWAYAAEVDYFWDAAWASYWDSKQRETGTKRVKVWWAITSPTDETGWQRNLYPLYGIGQWVWCVKEYQSDVWRVLHAFDNLIPFRLLNAMQGCGAARAQVLGHECPGTSNASSSTLVQSSTSTPSASQSGPGPSGSVASASTSESGSSTAGSSSMASSGSVASGSCSGGFNQPSTPGGGSTAASSSAQSSVTDPWRPVACCTAFVSRGTIMIYDNLGIVNTAFQTTCQAPAGTTGWAKYCADDGRFHAVSYGRCFCAASDSSGDVSWPSLSTQSSGSESSAQSSSGESSTVSASLSISASNSESAGSSSVASSVSSASSSPISSSGAGEGCDVTVVKDIRCVDNQLQIIYCTLHLPPGGTCSCDDDFSSASTSAS